MIFGKINGQKAHFETGNSPFLTEWVTLWPCGISLTGKYMFGPPVSDRFENALGDGSRLILTTGPDPVLERATGHLLQMGTRLGPAYLNDGLCAIMQPVLRSRGQMAFGPSLKNG
jgi:hypothetical protein